MLALTINGCSMFGTRSSNAPVPKQINFKVEQITQGTTMTLIAMVPMDVPNTTKKMVRNDTVFRVATDLLDNTNSSILIPKNSLLYGVYNNDGKSCSISWQVIYGDYRAMELHQGYLGIANRLSNFSCNPKTGVIVGNSIEVTFN